MARTRRSIAGRFLKKFEAEKPSYDLASKQASDLIREILVNNPALIHVITARCKSTASLLLKLREKRYGQPTRQITDLVAARVITYYKDHVALVVKALTDALEINQNASVDKREELEAVEFGYTSVHLIARTKGSWATSPQFFALRNRWFEIQVRSILEHAWAEIEHEVVYKSGIKYPTLVKRRFARMAGAIELLEDEFVALRDHQQQLISSYKEKYERGHDATAELDSVRLIALLELHRPESFGWRAAIKQGMPFPAHIEDRCVKALKQTGIRSGQALAAVLRAKELKEAESMFVREHRLSEPLSHLNTARLIVLLKSPVVSADYFPEMLSDPAIEKLLKRRRKRK